MVFVIKEINYMKVTGTNDVPGSGDNTDNPTPQTPKPDEDNK
jgi:hypothetical protein